MSFFKSIFQQHAWVLASDAADALRTCSVCGEVQHVEENEWGWSYLTSVEGDPRAHASWRHPHKVRSEVHRGTTVATPAAIAVRVGNPAIGGEANPAGLAGPGAELA